jgi:hypothetical protein
MRRVFLTLLVLALALPAFADIKIKTRNKFAGQAMESTVYIKGARQRSEMMGMTTILQCDQRQTVQLNDRTRMYMVSPLDTEEAEGAAPAPQPKPAPARTRKGGVITMVTALNDTGERKDMFGYQARRIKSSMSTESSPDACNQMKMRMETDGWYADLSPGLSCTATPGVGMGGPGMDKPECQDAFRTRRSGKGKLGYPLQATTTMYDDSGRATVMTTETVELSKATLDDKLFDVPAGYRIARSYGELMGMGNMGAMMSDAMRQAQQEGAEIDEEEVAAAMAAAGSSMPQPAPARPAPAPAAAPAVAPKATGSVRVGVVAIGDKTGRGMPTDNLREKLMAEIRLLNMDAVPLESVTPEEHLREAREKAADYILYTDVAALADPGQPLATAVTKRNPSPTDYHAQLKVKLISVARPTPVRLDTFITTSAPARDVDAVGDGITEEAAAVTEEIRNPKPKGATPAAKPAKKKP